MGREAIGSMQLASGHGCRRALEAPWLARMSSRIGGCLWVRALGGMPQRSPVPVSSGDALRPHVSSSLFCDPFNFLRILPKADDAQLTPGLALWAGSAQPSCLNHTDCWCSGWASLPSFHLLVASHIQDPLSVPRPPSPNPHPQSVACVPLQCIPRTSQFTDIDSGTPPLPAPSRPN